MRGADEFATMRARELRKTDNDAEQKLWSELRDRRLNGHKFVRQEPIGRYFADFACRQRKLVVEVDGSQHAESAYDKARDAFFNASGWSVMRFWNIDVLREREAVLETVLAALEERLEKCVTAPDLTFSAHEGYGKGNWR